MSGPPRRTTRPLPFSPTQRPYALALLAAVLPVSALAVTTAAFDLQGVEPLEEGKFDGVALLSDGRLVRAPRAKAVELAQASLAYTSDVDAQGRIYVGTGNQGEILRVEGDEVTVHAKLDVAVVTALAVTDAGLFAAGMPSATITKVADGGARTDFTTLDGVQQVWALAYDAGRKRLYAGTGPEGKLYAVDAQGHATLRADLEAEHILSLALGPDGSVYLGTSDGALLYRHDDARTEVVHDFPGDELGAIHVRDGRLAVAANDFPDLPPAPKSSAAAAKAPKLKPGKGEVWVVHPGGRAERLLGLDDSHVSDVELAADGTVFAAAASRGRVLRVDPDGEHGVWAEAEDRQVLGLGLTGRSPHFITADGAAVFRMQQESGPGSWTSAPLDAVTRARFGELTPRASGPVRWQTRSGNSEQADVGWSPWSRPTRGAGPVRSPAARYLQVRVLLDGEGAELRSLQALYLADNRPARSRDVREKKPGKAGDDDLVDGVRRIPPVRTLVWDTENPDDDALSYRLHVARDGSDRFLPLLHGDEQLAKAEYAWDTTTLPDGLYRVRVTTSDAPSNPPAYALQTQVLSALFPVDNHAPTLTLEIAGDALRGVAEDGASRIAALSLRIDDSPFTPIAADDDLLDRPTERFTYPLAALPTGTHLVSVRATDAAGNARIAALEVTRP